MSKVRDEFDRLHEERSHREPLNWGEGAERTCWHSTEEPFFEPEEKGEGWASALTEAVRRLLDSVSVRQREHARLESIEGQLRSLAAKIEDLPKQLRVPITSLAPEAFELLKPIEVVIQCVDEEDYVASFFDANVNASGCNPNNAFANLVETIVSRFDTLDKLPPEKLGKGPKRQIAVLREFIRRRD